MIDTKELMYGNWVFHNDGPIKIEGITKNLLIFLENKDGVRKSRLVRPSEINPIPIDEKLLEKCGFEKEELPSYMDKEYTKDGVQVNLKGGEVYLSSFKGELSEIRYLHELQNTYFMITKEQLEVDFQ